MELEHYLIDEKNYIISINKISQMIDFILKDNYYSFSKENNNKNLVDEIIALNSSIRMITYCLRQHRKEYYQEIDENYEDKFTLDETLNG